MADNACKVEECVQDTSKGGKGYCGMHWARVKKTGEPGPAGKLPRGSAPWSGKKGRVIREWSEDELAVIASREGLKDVEIARLIDRSARAIAEKRRQIARGQVIVRPAWTAEEDQVIRDGRGLTSEQLAEKLPGRTAQACKARRSALRVPLIAHPSELNPRYVAHRPLIAKTCTQCGNLLPSKWFIYHKNQKQWSASCRSCSNNKTKDWYRGQETEYRRANSLRGSAYQDRAQEITIPAAKRSGQEYVGTDYQILEDPGLTILTKALLTQRTYKATASKLSREGLKSRKPIGDPTRDIWIIDNPNTDRVDEITKELTDIFEAAPLTQAERQLLWDWDE